MGELFYDIVFHNSVQFIKLFFMHQLLSFSTKQFQVHYLLGELSIVDSYYPW